jgi:hypothetical protein
LNVSSDVAIASLDLSLCEIEENSNRLILLDQMKQEELIRDLPQIFQSCTFNRSVTSPVSNPSMDRRRMFGSYHSAERFSTNWRNIPASKNGRVTRELFVRSVKSLNVFQPATF